MDPNDGPLAKLAGVGFLQLFVLDLSCVGDPPGVAVQSNHAAENMSTMIQVQVTSAYTNHLETKGWQYYRYIRLEYSGYSLFFF